MNNELSSMIVVELRAENYKRLKAVQFKPSKNVQIIGGRNAQGKTSVLDAIFSALAGSSASKQIAQPIRDGEDHAEVTVDLGEIVVTRTWKDDKSTLVVKSKLGAVFSSPQKLLDDLLGRLSFDPLDFTRLESKAQVNALMDIIGLSDALEYLATDRLEAYTNRTEAGRSVKSYSELLANLGEREDAPSAITSAQTLLDDFSHSTDLLRQSEELAKSIVDLTQTIGNLESQLLETENLLRIEEIKFFELEKPKDLGEIKNLLENLDESNQAVRRNNERAEMEVGLDKATEKMESFTKVINQCDKDKKSMLANAWYPIEGLGFGENGVEYNGVPFTQCSASEQIRVSLAMAMELSPTVKLIFIRDGSLLDDESMAEVSKTAEEKGYQIFIERVGDADGVGVIIEDGEIK